jgi:Short C-terminal domain/Phospholipase_D-nuclease N-terminal
MSFWDVVWFIFISFAFVAYLMVLFSIIGDLFRDRDTSGWIKAIWIVMLIVLPLLTALVYVVNKDEDMARRSNESLERQRREQESYIHEVTAHTRNPAEDIAKAREMLDAGIITQAEFERLKEKALV